MDLVLTCLLLVQEEQYGGGRIKKEGDLGPGWTLAAGVLSLEAVEREEQALTLPCKVPQRGLPFSGSRHLPLKLQPEREEREVPRLG